MFAKKSSKARSTNPSSVATTTFEITSLTTKFDDTIKSLPTSLAQPVCVPANKNDRLKYLKQLALRSASQLAAGGTALVLVLLSAQSGHAQSTDVAVKALDGVKSVEIEADGSATVTLENGTVMQLPAGSFATVDGEVLVSQAVAAQIADAGAAAGGVSAGLIAGVLGGVGLVAAAAGGGGGSSDSDSPVAPGPEAPTPDAPTASGSVIDGYIVNATVFQDVNGNSIFDAGEPNTITDAQGGFNITLDPSNPTASLISFGGTDTSTGQAFTGTLTAPAGSEVITPLTTLVQSVVEASAAEGNPISVEDANQQLAAALGLGGQDLLALDPVAEIEEGGDPEAFAAAAQVAAVISAAAAAAGDSTEESTAASQAVAAQLAESLLEAGADSQDLLQDEATIQQALEGAGVDTADAEVIAGKVGEVNADIDATVDGGGDPSDVQGQIEAAQEVVQDVIVGEIQDPDGDVGSINVTEEIDSIVPLRPDVTTEAPDTVFGPNNPLTDVTVQGTGRPDALVRVTIDGVAKTTTVDGSGDWLITFAANELPSETGVFQVDAAGATSGSSIFTTPASGGTLTLDFAGPDAPSFDAVAGNGILELDEQEADLTVSGTTEAGAEVEVAIGGVTLTTTADGSGAFSVTFDAADLPGSDFDISATATDTLGNIGTAAVQPITVEPVSALTLTIAPVSGILGSAELADGLTVSGTGRPDSTVTVTIDGVALDTTVDGNGDWSVIFDQADLPDATGDFDVTAQATLQGTSFSSGVVDGGGFSVDLTAPAAPAVSPVAGNDVLELEEQGSDLSIGGTAEAGATVAVTIGGTTESTVAADDGTFAVTFSALDVPATDFAVSTTATDPLGNEGSATVQNVSVEPVSALTPVVSTVSGVFGPTQLASGLTVSGTGRIGSTVNTTISDTTLSAEVQPDGTWSVFFSEGDLPNTSGDFDVSAVATLDGTSFESGAVDGGGFTVDLDAAPAPVINTVAGNDVLELEEREGDLIVSGAVEVGATVAVTIDGVTETATADGDGNFNVTFSAADVPEADFTISATATDTLGNTSATATLEIAVEPASALTPVVSTVTGTFGASELAAGLTVTGTGRPGSTVDVAIDGAVLSATVQPDESWNVSFLESDLPNTSGNYAVTAIASLQGTSFTSDQVSGGGFSVDLTPPDAPVLNAVTGNDVLELEEQEADLTITGTAETGATVEVTIGGTTESTIADGDGNFSVTFASADVPNSDFSVSASATDGVDNQGVTAARDVTVEPVSALTPTVDDASASLGISDRADGLDITGSGRPGSTVTVTIGSTSQTAVVAANGLWLATFAEADLPASSGTFSVSAVATLEGTSFTSSSVSGGNIEFDLDVPNAPTIDAITGDDFLSTEEQSSDLTVTGSAEIGATVVVEINGVFQQAIAGDDGSYSVTFASDVLPTSDFSISATAEDGVGNQSASAVRQITVQPAGQTIVGTFGDDVLDGTDGDDVIDPAGNADGFDLVNGSLGNDEIVFTNSGGESFVEVDYSGLLDPINATLNYADNTGTVVKGAGGVDGTDTFTDPTTTGAFGIGLVGTAGDDTFNIVQGAEFSWAGIFYAGGDDMINVDANTGTVRIGAGTDVTADLTTGIITNSTGSITLNVMGEGAYISLRTGNGDDTITGSAADEQFILGAGTDVLNAGGGFDQVRYDRSGVEGGVTVNLQTGTATGVWDGLAFDHALTGVESVRGSRTGNDDLTAADTGSQLSGRGGDDTLRGGAGDDVLIGGAGADVFVVGQGNDTIVDYEGDDIDDIQLSPSFTDAEIDAAIANAVQDGDDVVVTLPNGATVRVQGWTVAEFQADVGGSSTATIVGTFGDDVLDGTDGDDVIDPAGNADGFDLVNGSLGNDEIVFTNSGGESFVEVDYSGLLNPINATLDYANNTGTVVKGVDGVDGMDTFTDPTTTGGFGIGLVGTSGDDTFNIVQGSEFTWAGIFYAGGDDTINVDANTGTVRIGAGTDVTADLTTGIITNSTGSITLNVMGEGAYISLRTGNGDDTITGSAADEQFILGAGTDVLNAGGGFDQVRYDRSGVEGGVTVNLQTGTATGVWDGLAFDHALTGVESVRGSRTGNDDLTAADTGSQLSGRGGDDTLRGGAGDDVLIGGAGADVFVVGQGNDTIVDYEGDDIDDIQLSPSFTDAEIDAAIANAVQDGDDVVVTLPNGATVRVQGWTVAEFQADVGGSSTATIVGTFGDDVLDGTDGDDVIDPAGNADGFDLVNGSLGNDEIVFTNSGGESFVEVDYSGLLNPINATLDYANNTGTVVKGVDGVDGMDTFTDPTTTGGFGIGLVGTSGDDTFNIVQGSEFTWAGIFYAGGDDTINVDANTGTVRIGAGTDVTADLTTGIITNSTGSITLNVMGEGAYISLRTGNGDDTITGSAADEQFILGAGTDVLNAGGGFDQVRYDRSGVEGGVTVNLQTGTATGVWDGLAFDHALTGVESVRGSRDGDDDLTAADTGSQLEGRGGNDVYTGGAGEDIFIVGVGNDVVFGFDLELDQLQDRGGAFDGALPDYSEVDFDGQPSLRFDLGSGNSVTLAGISVAQFENTLIQEVLPFSPETMDDPAILTLNGPASLNLIASDALSNDLTQSAGEFTFEETVGLETYSLSVVGSGLGVSGPLGSEVYSGTVDAATMTLGSDVVWSFTNLGIEFGDFVTMLNSAVGLGDIDASLGLGSRDLVVVGDDTPQDLFVEGVDQWIETGGGDDAITFDRSGTGVFILGGGSDTVNLQDGDGQAYIYIDPDDLGIDQINGFRFNDDDSIGDRIVIEDQRADFSLTFGVDDVTDQGALDAIASTFDDIGEGEYVLFFDSSGNAVMQELIGSNTLGQTVATFSGADTSTLSDGHPFEPNLVFAEDLELPATSVLV